MRILLAVLGFVALLFLIFIGVAFFLPDHFELRREVHIQKPIEEVYPLVSDLRNWELWAPWVNGDASIKVHYGEHYKGVGSTYSWESSNSGSGKMVIREEAAPYRIVFELWFEGWDAPSKSIFELEEVNGGTRLTWIFSGKLGADPVQRWFGILIDRMVGGMFESGLESIKIVAEEQQAAA